MKRMTKRPVIVALALMMTAISLPSFSQNANDKTLLTVGNEKITAGEFLNIYNKNNAQSEAIDPKTIDEYLDLFINFRLKVKDAEQMGLDTMKSFKDELAGYRKQLAQPYFTDESVIDNLTLEAFDRTQFDVRASHILIRCAADALPADTLAAWKKITDIRKKIVKGADFGAMAAEKSDDQSARDQEANKQHPAMKGNRGDLGFFTVFNMVYPFETAAYNTPIGEVSPIVRTDFGYHILKIADRKPALGRVTAAHIFFTFPKNASSADSANLAAHVDSVYNRLKAGEKWDELTLQYSADKASAAKGGQLPPFTCNRLVPEFMSAVYDLKNPEDFSKPVLTTYGWHIIKLIEKKTPGTFDESKTDLKQRITRDNRGRQSQDVVVARLKAEYKLKEEAAALQEVIALVTDSIFAGTWVPATLPTRTLFAFDNQKVTTAEFVTFLSKQQKKQDKENIAMYVTKRYHGFVIEHILAYEDQQLESKYPDFKSLVKEYRDGILLFELTDRLVWTKAVKDTTGLRTFYQTVKQKYMWPERKSVSILTVSGFKSQQEASDMMASIEKWTTRKGKSLNWVRTELMKDTLLTASLTDEKYVAGENPIVDKLASTEGAVVKEQTTGDDKPVITWAVLNKIVVPEPKALEEVKGLVTAEYQNQLEKEWIETLRKQYHFEVDRSVLSQIK